MNSMPEMNPAMLQTPSANSSLHDESYPVKSDFASLVENEYSKVSNNSSHKKEAYTEGAMKEDDVLNGDTSACSNCTADINNTMQNTQGNNVRQETDDIELVERDEEHAYDEIDPERGLKTSELLFALVHGEIGSTLQVPSADGTSGTTVTGPGGPEGETASENGLKVGTRLNNLINNYTAETEGGLGLSPESAQDVGLSVSGSSDLSAGNGLKIGVLLKNLAGSDAGESGKVPGVNSGNEENVKSIEVESVKAGADLHAENGLKLGDLFSKDNNNTEKAVSDDGAVEVRAEAVEAEADSLIFKKEMAGQDGTKNEVSGHMEKIHADGKTAVTGMPESTDNTEGLKSRPVSGSLDQSSHENGKGDNAFNFAKGSHNVRTDAETNNAASLNTSNTTFESARSIQGPSSLHAAKTPGAQELLDNVIYVIKGNSKMGVSVEHENLGKLNMSLSLEKGMVNVHINTSDRAVREFLENNIQHIIDSLNKDGVSVGEFTVALKDQREHEMNNFSSKNQQGGEIPHETKKEHRHSGLINIFA